MANSNVQTHPPSENKTLWAWLIGTFFGAGLLKPGPGTYGSISAVLLWHAVNLHPLVHQWAPALVGLPHSSEGALVDALVVLNGSAPGAEGRVLGAPS